MSENVNVKEKKKSSVFKPFKSIPQKWVIVGLVAAAIIIGIICLIVTGNGSSNSVQNVYTNGEVSIYMDENLLGENGKAHYSAKRVLRNENVVYEPGKVLELTPTITVKQNSEDAYVRTIVSIIGSEEAISMIQRHDYWRWFDFDEADPLNRNWREVFFLSQDDESIEGKTILTYEFRYHGIVEKNETEDTVLEPLFTTISVPANPEANFSNEEIELLKDLEIIFEAHAIEVADYASANIAWDSFKK